jgi:putative tryptophan/tyrosine transport system substrate-binding protein
MPRRIGLLHSGSKAAFDEVNGPVGDLRAALPSDVQIVEKYANDDIGELEDDADDLANDGTVLAIVAGGGPPSAIAAMEATETQSNPKPVVFTTVADPVASGLVNSLTAPGRNLTGMAGQTSELDPKRVELLKDFVPAITEGTTIGVLINPGRDHHQQQYATLKAKADNLRLSPIRRRTNSEKGIKRAFNHFNRQNVVGVVVTADPFFYNNRQEVVQNAARVSIPTIYQWRQFAEAGGLISYGPSIIKEAYRRAGEYVKRILDNGESPSTMACSKPDPSGFELVVNGTAAANLHLRVPATIGGIPVIVI